MSFGKPVVASAITHSKVDYSLRPAIYRYYNGTYDGHVTTYDVLDAAEDRYQATVVADLAPAYNWVRHL